MYKTKANCSSIYILYLVFVTALISFLTNCEAAFADVFQELLGDACRFADGHNILPRAGALAMLAAECASEERFDDLYQAELIYIRKSEAEVQWEARQQNQNN